MHSIQGIFSIPGRLTNGPVDVDEKTRLVSRVHTRDCNLRARRSRTTTSNSDLSARDVELGTTDSRRAVDSDMFHSDQVIARGKRLRDCESPLTRSCVNPLAFLCFLLLFFFLFYFFSAEGTDRWELTNIESNCRAGD